MMYFLTTIQEKNNEIIDQRCVGYFETYEEAANILLHNFYDINETIYNYAVIEAIPSGIYQYDTKPHWFSWLGDSYIQAETPPFAKNCVRIWNWIKKGGFKMSDYVKKKAVRYKLKQNEIQDFEKLLIDDESDFLPELLLQYYNLTEDYKLKDKKDFTINYGCNYADGDEIYVDYMLEYEYGANGDYISTRELTKKEYDKYLPMFKERFSNLDINELHYVDYCYYNGVDEPAVYDLKEI